MTETPNMTADFQSTLGATVAPEQLMANLANAFKDTRASSQARPSARPGLAKTK